MSSFRYHSHFQLTLDQQKRKSILELHIIPSYHVIGITTFWSNCLMSRSKGDLFGPNSKHLSRLLGGASDWNKWRKANPEIVPVLRFADLSGMVLEGMYLWNCNFAGANLRGARLLGSNLYQAEFFQADLSNAQLVETDLRGAKFHDANLSHASLRYSNLFRVDFIQTKLDGTDLAGAYLHTTAFSNVDLSKTLGLDEVFHGGPSSIDIQTLLKTTQGPSTSFLAGTGIPLAIVIQLSNLNKSQSFRTRQSCFISYSHADEDFARALYSRLKACSVQVWFAPEDMKAGKKIYDQVDSAIRRHDRLILVLSESSLRSQWVATELLRAKALESIERRRVLFPIRLVPFETLRSWSLLDSQSGKDIAAEVREYHIPDFSNWADKSFFDNVTQKLVEDLEKENG